MNSTHRIRLAIAWLLLAASSAFAQCPNGGCPNSRPQERSIGTFRGGASKMPTVTSFKDGILIAGSRTYVVDPYARIVIDGKQATAKDIEVGMRVAVSGTRVPSATKGESVFRATRVTARR
jgi:hypothetical protein